MRRASIRKELERGRAAWARRAWDDAYASFVLADRTAPLEAADLEQLALCAGLTGRVEEFLGAFERLYNTHLDAGDEVAAARAAFWVGFRLYGLRDPAAGPPPSAISEPASGRRRAPPPSLPPRSVTGSATGTSAPSRGTCMAVPSCGWDASRTAWP